MVRRWELSYDWWKSGTKMEAWHPFTGVYKPYSDRERLELWESRVYERFNCIPRSRAPYLFLCLYQQSCPMLSVTPHCFLSSGYRIIWLLLLFLVFWMPCNAFRIIWYVQFTSFFQIALTSITWAKGILGTTSLHAQGKNKVCIHTTLCRLHLWDYTMHVVLRRLRAMSSFSLTLFRTWNWLISHNKELATPGLVEKNLLKLAEIQIPSL